MMLREEPSTSKDQGISDTPLTNATEKPSSSLTRREMIASAATVAATAALGEPSRGDEPATPPKSQHKPVDVIIVGGGLAGLAAARALVAQQRTVLVLEANDRVGGRTWTEKVSDGVWVDNGGQWIGPGQDRILALAKAVGVETFPTFTEGKNVLYYKGARSEYAGDPTSAPVPANELKDFETAMKKVDELAVEVPVDDPGSAKNAGDWDSQTFATWIRDNVPSAGGRFMMRLICLGYFAVEPSEISFMHVLFYVHAAGGFEKLHTAGVASRFVGGSQEVSNRVAKELGDRVLLKTPVRRIDQNKDNVVVYSDHATFEGKRAIVAVPPNLAVRIFFDPPMPAVRDQFMQRDPMGATIKCHAVYATPFWRKKGLNGWVCSDDGDVVFAADNSPPDGKTGILCGFLEGKGAREWADRSVEDLRKMVLAAFEKFFGPEAAEPKAFYTANWMGQIWSRGCFSGVMPPGAWSAYSKVVRAPVGRIHWAGTETSTSWCQYMDGAVRSGERAADEVVKELGKK